MRRALPFALLVLATTARAETARAPKQVATANPETAAAAQIEGTLERFEKALASQRAGTATRALRVSWFGDSLTADDSITNVVRQKLGALVGKGGPGYVFAAPPHPYNRHRAVDRFSTGSWRVHGISSSVAPDKLLGFGGSAESEGSGTIRLTAHAPVSLVDLHYLEQPRGGKLAIVVGNKVVQELATAGEAKQAAFAQVALPTGTKRVELRARGRVRLFGASLEAARGVVVDNLGVVNGTAKQLVKYNRADHWKHQLAHRDADLIVVMLGTNEAEWLHAKGAGMAEHERLFGELLATIRKGNASASCLVVSPLDQLDWREPNMPPRASVPAMVDAQRRAARANGCAFWDVYQWMGGKGSSRQWFKRRLLIKDFQHPTTAGATKIADALYAALIR